VRHLPVHTTSRHNEFSCQLCVSQHQLPYCYWRNLCLAWKVAQPWACCCCCGCSAPAVFCGVSSELKLVVASGAKLPALLKGLKAIDANLLAVVYWGTATDDVVEVRADMRPTLSWHGRLLKPVMSTEGV